MSGKQLDRKRRKAFGENFLTFVMNLFPGKIQTSHTRVQKQMKLPCGTVHTDNGTGRFKDDILRR